MDPKFFGLNEKIGRIVKVPADQGRIVATAVALAAAAHARLPSSPVENVSVFYADQVHAVAMETISDMNESVVFAAKTALEYAQTFWKLRYYAAFPVQMVEMTDYRIEHLLKTRAPANMDLTTLWAGGMMEVSDELSSFMNKYRVEIATLAADLVKLLAPRVAPTGDEDIRG